MPKRKRDANRPPVALVAEPMTEGSEERPFPAGEEVSQKEPSLGKGLFPIVGLGASAGGLEAFQGFFANLPENPGMAFVLVQHLDANHPSILPALIQNDTVLPVLQVQGDTPVVVNTIYVIPPNHHLLIQDGILFLRPPLAAKGRYFAIDHFFRSLAQDRHRYAACVILSGTGTDGTLGLKAIKENGGLVITQVPASAKYDGMPQSALETGMSDYILPPEQIPRVLVDYFFTRGAPSLPLSETNKESHSGQLNRIFALLRTHAGHDFALYKENTILRRVERRMAMLQVQKLADYVIRLQENPDEVRHLFRDLLIGVSNFFRDPEAFEALGEKVIPTLLESHPESHPIRIWVPGCASGEEAYSIAILLREAMERQGREHAVQIFATDIDDRAIEDARQGLFPDTIATDVPGPRLRRFFMPEGNHYRIRKVIRDMLVIAPQSVIRDPPFSNLDLISCRNLLIYLGPALQTKVLSLFHYALEPEGFLFLGTSETTGDSATAYQVIDRKWKIYRHKADASLLPPDFLPPAVIDRGRPRKRLLPKHSPGPGLKELMEQHLLNDHTPTCLMVNERFDVMYIHGDTGLFLDTPSGEVHWNVLKLARDGLSLELASALRQVKTTGKALRHEKLRVKRDGICHLVNLMVEPMRCPETLQGWMWLLFEDLGVLPGKAGTRKEKPPKKRGDQRLAGLEEELKSTKAYLQTTIEELESSNEQLKSMNEELQASNEELQSANEELETAKEESQSVNEELVTVNAEYEEKLNRLAKANNDMVNLMASTEIGTIFLDEDLRVVRFTPSATRFVNLIPGDIGRPIRHLVSNLKGKDLSRYAESVLESLIPVEFETQTEEDQWLSIRVRPYRTVDNVIEGVVIAFVDISEIKQMQENLRLSEERFRVALQNSSLAIVVANVDERLRYTWIYSTHPRVKVDDYLGKRDDEIGDHPGLQRLLALKQRVLQGVRGEQEIIVLPLPDGLMTCKVSAEPLFHSSGKVIGVTTVAIDISDRPH
ncbi:MAG: PAS domain-containing protein [Magnetococcales bacterium]|nr:PAS domain-containing protein [Magnetococcales bacterium]